MRASALMPVGLFGAMAVALGLGLGHNPRELPSMLADKPVPEFTLPALDGGSAGLSSRDVSHGRVTLLNVFASWCGGCRFEHPMLMRLAKDERWQVVGLNWKDTLPHAAKFIADNGNPYRIIGIDESGRTGIDFGVTGVPETFVIDGEGRVRFRLPGPLTPESWTNAIEPVLAEIEKRP